MMDRVLGGMEGYAAAYLDDLVVYSSSWEDHISHLEVVFNRLKQTDLL